MHDAIRVQSAPFLAQCKQSAAGRRWRPLCRLREWRFRVRRRRSRALGGLWFLRPFPGGSRRWAGRLKFRDYWIGIDRGRGGRGEISGNTDYLHLNSCRLELVQGVSDRETAVGGGHGDRAGCLAAWPQGGAGVGSLRRRFKLHLHGWRRRFEGIQGKRRAAGQAESGCGHHDDTTHDKSVTLVRRTAAIPIFDHRSVETAAQLCGPASLSDG